MIDELCTSCESTLITCNGSVEVCWVQVTFSVSKSLAKHGLGREAFLCNEPERSSVLHIILTCWLRAVVVLTSWYRSYTALVHQPILPLWCCRGLPVVDSYSAPYPFRHMYRIGVSLVQTRFSAAHNCITSVYVRSPVCLHSSEYPPYERHVC